MIWNKHLSFEGKHAVLSPSKYQWINDDEEDIVKRLCATYAPTVGTLLHEEAKNFIAYRSRMTKNEKRSVAIHLLANGVPHVVLDNIDFDGMFANVCAYVNDAVCMHMSPEVVLFYSEYCFGTADSILYDEKNRILRIHDLKTGITPAKMEQLYIYAALFFLEYNYIKLSDTKTELRIYQSNNVLIDEPSIDIILPIMEKIKQYSNIAAGMR